MQNVYETSLRKQLTLNMNKTLKVLAIIALSLIILVLIFLAFALFRVAFDASLNVN